MGSLPIHPIMTGKELIEKLQQLTPEQLEQQVVHGLDHCDFVSEITQVHPAKYTIGDNDQPVTVLWGFGQFEATESE